MSTQALRTIEEPFHKIGLSFIYLVAALVFHTENSLASDKLPNKGACPEVTASALTALRGLKGSASLQAAIPSLDPNWYTFDADALYNIPESAFLDYVKH